MLSRISNWNAIRCIHPIFRLKILLAYPHAFCYNIHKIHSINIISGVIKEQSGFMNYHKTEQMNFLFKNKSAILKASELKAFGFSSRNLKKMIDTGLLEKIKQGYYVLSENTGEIPDILIALKLIPQGVICLLSAIEHYELSTVNPSSTSIALPRKANIPTLPSSRYIKIYRMTDKHFKLGISEAELNGVKIRIYDIEKVICDCFKYDKQIEKNIALEVLKNYVSRKNCNIQKLLEYAKIMGKKKVMLPYIEALL